MLHRTASSSRVRFFRPSLESLEERNLLSSTAYTGLLDDLSATIKQNQDLIAYNAFSPGPLTEAVGKDISNFQKAPHDVNALLQLVTDGSAFISLASQLRAETTLFIYAVQAGEAKGLVTGDPVFQGSTLTNTSHYNNEVTNFQGALPFNQKLVGEVEASIFAAVFVFLSQGSGDAVPTLTLPTPPGASTGGGYGVTYSDPPGSASASGPSIAMSASITASAGNDAAITATMTCTFSDGTAPQSNSVSIDPGAQQPLSLSVMPCTAGSTATWTVNIDGNVDHTATTTFTP